jgi:hypothetical protein
MAGTVKFIQGDTISATITIKDSNGDAVDVTGGVVKFRIVSEIGDLKAAAVYNNDAVTLTTPTSGICTLSITRAVTAAWTAGTHYKWEVEFIDSASSYSHTDSGALIIQKSLYSADA